MDMAKRFFPVLLLLVFIVLPACETSSDTKKVLDTLADRLSDALEFDDGNELSGEPPASNDSSTAPAVKSLDAPEEFRIGAPFILDIFSEYATPTEITAVIIQVKGAQRYIRVLAGMANGQITLSGVLEAVSELKGQDFVLRIALQTNDTMTGPYFETGTLHVSDLDPPEFSDSLAALKIEESEKISAAPPQAISGSTAPQITKLEAANELSLDEEFSIHLKSDYQEDVQSAILTVPRGSGYLEIPGTLQNQSFSIDGLILSKIQKSRTTLKVGDRLVFLWALKSKSNTVGLYRSWVVTIIASVQTDGDEELAPEWEIESDITTEGETEQELELPPDGDPEMDAEPERLEEPELDDESEETCTGCMDYAGGCVPEGNLRGSSGNDSCMECKSGNWMEIPSASQCDDGKADTVNDRCFGGGNCLGDTPICQDGASCCADGMPTCNTYSCEYCSPNNNTCMARKMANPELIHFFDFQTPVADYWSVTSYDQAPSGEKFLGRFTNETATFSRSGLAAHDMIQVSFDLYIIGGWKGETEIPDEQVFTITLQGKETPLLEASFSNAIRTAEGINEGFQSFPQGPGQGYHPPQTWAVSRDALGYSSVEPFVPDATYHFCFTLAHNSSDVLLKFLASGVTDINEASWGIDNFELSINKVTVDGDAESESEAEADVSDEIWVDPWTTLQWQKFASASPVSKTSADNICDALTIDGKSDWRVPSISELRSLVRNCTASYTAPIDGCNVSDSCSMASQCFSANSCQACAGAACYGESNLADICQSEWSSTSNMGATNSQHWTLNFIDGGIIPQNDTSSHYVRCVSGQTNDPDWDSIPVGKFGLVCKDGVATSCDDNCPNTYNPLQEDKDNDAIGDACDSNYFTAFTFSETTSGGDAGCYSCSTGQPNTASTAETVTTRFFEAPDSIRLYAYGDNGGMCTQDYYTCRESVATFSSFSTTPATVSFWMNADPIPWDNRFVASLEFYACDNKGCQTVTFANRTCDVTNCAAQTDLHQNCDQTAMGADGRSWCRHVLTWPASLTTPPYYFKFRAFGQRWDNNGQDSWIEVYLDNICLSNANGICLQ